VAAIESAQAAVTVENEELSDPAIVQALVRDEERGLIAGYQPPPAF
jgi:hypothetical protein